VKRRFLTGLLSAAIALSAITFTPNAHGTIIERVVAVVGDRPILLSELRHRARPFLFRILLTTPGAAQQASAESEMLHDLLNRIIDDRLEEQAADKARIVVTSDEIDNAIKNVAAQQRIKPSDLITVAKSQGLTEQDYRDEIRRQLLEGKLVQLRVRGRVRVTEQDARAAYSHWVKDFQEQSPVDLRILALRIPPGATEEVIKVRETLAQQLTMQARAGKPSDFCNLVKQYGDDPQTRDTCGSHGPQAMAALRPPLDSLAQSLKEGETADPIRIGTEAVIIVQMAQTPQIPPYTQVQDAMMERAFGEAMERQRKLWLDELRHGVYLEVRM
jgi:peptidyl-prolyl cis-trans isomerase SurA